MHKISYSRQDISEEDIRAVADVLRSDYLTQGPRVTKFEELLAKKVGAKYAVVVSSGTAALHLAALSLGLKSGDWLWTSPNSFAASANCGLYCGAAIDFIDIELDTYNIDLNFLEEKLNKASRTHSLPKIIVPVHFAGHSCDMETLRKLTDKFGVKVIEDAAHALGGSYKGVPVGSARFSDLVVSSFHPVKSITSAEGGVIFTNSEDLYDRLKLLRSHGITRDVRLLEDKSQGDWYYEQIEIGYHYRLSDVHAALGISQLDRLDEFIEMRRQRAQFYNHALKGLGVILPTEESWARSAWHLYVIRLKPDLVKSRFEVFQYMRKNGIEVNVHYIPIHWQPVYKKLGFKRGDFPNSKKYYEATLSLPLFPKISEKELNFVVSTLIEALS